VKLSQANGQAFHDGDQDVRAELVPNGFKVVLTEYGNKFYCTTCDACADHKMPIRHPKRPRDFSQAASGQVHKHAKDDKAGARGKARSAKLTSSRRSEIAKLAAQTRWKKSP
jgi:hypothetical protein